MITYNSATKNVTKKTASASKGTKSSKIVKSDATKKVAKTKAEKLDSFVKKNKTQYPTGTWVVFTTPEGKDGKRQAPKVFAPSFTRDKVRSTYAKVMGVSMTATRSRRVENY
jgi:hypothetical protein